MRAHVLMAYGTTPDNVVFQDTVSGALGPEDVRVEVRAVAINPVDLKTRVGEPKMLLPFSPPFVLGVDLAGTVTEVGTAVTTLARGDSVFAYAGMDRMGAFAESVLLPQARVARSPHLVDAQQAACLPLPGLCALQALDEAQVTRGTRVLIHGGAGAVGSLAVQLAHQRGAEVYATASAGDVARVRDFGAAHVVDHRAGRFEDAAREVDVVLDTVGGDTLKRSFKVVRRGGVVATLHVPPEPHVLQSAGLRAPWLLRALLPLVTSSARGAARAAGARLVPILTVPDGKRLAEVARASASGGLSVVVDKVFPFDALGAALEHAGSGRARGRVVLTRN